MAFTLGIDYGTNSVRALFVDVSDGRELATCVVDYPSGKQGILLDPRDANVARQGHTSYADVTGCTMYVAGSSQACALGPAISSAVLAGPKKGGYADFHSAQQAMTSLKPVSYSPKPENQTIYNQLYVLYRQLHDAFGGISKCAELSGAMKELIHIKEEQVR
jgi:ribulose kinase